MRIAFIENHLSIRGTTQSIYDYADQNEHILHNESFIITRPYHLVQHSIDADKIVYDKFASRFKICYYTHVSEIPAILQAERADAAYVQKSGDSGDGLYNFGVCKTFVHAVFQPRCPHGDFYAGISDWLNIQFKTNIPVLPYIATLPNCDDNMRETLQIPKDAIVFGRHGGYDAFDLVEAQQAVERVSRERPDIYFVFLHTRPFCSARKNIIHLTRITDPIEKVKFINTCDAMVYGRSEGETFGLAIAEFSMRNKPIFGIYEHHKMESLMHKVILKDRAFWWKTEEELVQKMLAFTPEQRDTCQKEDWNMYRDYSPENVMKLFDSMMKYMIR
jgi:hypothetical protein